MEVGCGDVSVFVKPKVLSPHFWFRWHLFFDFCEYHVLIGSIHLQVAKVLESKDKKYPVGSLMVSHQGWCDKGKINPSKLPPTEFCMPAPDLHSAVEGEAGLIRVPGEIPVGHKHVMSLLQENAKILIIYRGILF